MLLLASIVAAFAQVELRPGPVPLDVFHPERTQAIEPRRGGSATVHVPALPPSLNAMIESSGTTRQILQELHESLVRRDPESWEFIGVLAKSFEVEDRVQHAGGGTSYGVAERVEKGWRLRGGGAVDVEFDDTDVVSIDRRVAYTFHLREDVRWHDGHPFDARDVLFSFECFRNPAVRCDRKRYLFDKIARADALDAHTVRFEFAQPYFLALSTFDESFTLLPAHVYDLADPDHPARKLDATPAEQAKVVNEGAANRAWIGLGPYKLASWTGDVLEAERFDGYFDLSRCAWLDRLRWRAIADVNAAANALPAGELDFFDRLSSDDYFGARTQDVQFTEGFCKGYFYTPSLSVTAWNTARPKLADARVRTALGMCFDWKRYIDGYYRGLAFRVTGEQMPFGPSYDRELAPLPFDPRRAKELLAEAGWFDRDGDGRIEKDGEALSIGYLYPAGNETSRTFGEAFQAELAKIGVALELQPRDNASLADSLRRRDFDSAALGLALPFESDPEQLWHSKWAASASANRSGLADPDVDRRIEALQSETDDAKRSEAFRALQRKLYELQPVLFGVWAPRRFAISKRLRGVQLFALDPGYSLRRWFRTDALR